MESLSTPELHRRLHEQKRDVEANWAIVKELLIRHQFNVNDFQILGNQEIYKFRNVDDDTYNDQIFELTNSLTEISFSDRIIPGSDLTEEDIHEIFAGEIFNETTVDLWAAYVINDRFSHLGEYDLETMLIDSVKNEDYSLARLANVNADFAALVYDQIYTYPDMMKKFIPLLEPRARLIFANHRGLKIRDLPRGLKREPQTIPTLKEIAKSYVHPKTLARESKFVHDL